MLKEKFIIFFILFVLIKCSVYAGNFVIIKAKKGDSIYGLLNKYKLNTFEQALNDIKIVNAKNLTKDNGLFIDEYYILPIQIVKFDGKTIRSSTKIKDFGLAKKIEEYNIDIQNSGLKDNYKKTMELWIPIYLYKIYDYDTSIQKQEIIKNQNVDFKDKNNYEFFKEKVNVKNHKLKGYIFYLISGHGGPDPGAIGYRDSVELNEDEYAYDITIRLAKKLVESNAKVYMIVQDTLDGIRNDKFLKDTNSELLINGDSISSIQLTRLKQRTDLVNKYVIENNEKKVKKQFLLELHVDSRVEDQRIDIFFYHRSNCQQSKNLCNSLYNTINRKYKKTQPGRDYFGTISTRDLYTLRNTNITAAYIELGNIQNPKDQLRFIRADNRQAIANWLYEGIINNIYIK